MKKFRKSILKSILLSTILLIIIWAFSLPFLYKFMSGYSNSELVLLFIGQCILISLVIAFLNYVIRLELFQSKEYLKLNETLDEKIINESINKIFNSKNFLRVFKETLPQGQTDKEYGIDYIPYLLAGIELKKDFFKKNTRAFFTGTIVLAIISISSILYFSYILINNDAVGLTRTLKETENIILFLDKNIKPNNIQQNTTENIREQANKLNSKINIFYTKISDLNQADTIVFRNFQNTFSSVDTISIYNYSGIASKIESQIENVKKSLKEKIKRNSGRDEDFIAEIRTFKNTLINLPSNYQIMANNYYRQLNDLEDQISIIKRKVIQLDNNNYRFYSFFERLSIGVITVSFLIMILRFIAKQFIKNQNEMIKSHSELLQARRFYISIKSSQSPEERLVALNAFLQSNTEAKEPQKVFEDMNSNALIKEMLNTISKKL